MTKAPKTSRIPANAQARQTRRAAIAKGVLEQRAPSEIAASLGITRQTVHNELRAPETQELIRAWMAPHHAAIRRMIPRALAAVHTGLKPSQKTADRLQAVKTLGTILQWTEGRANDGDNQPQRRFAGQFEELLILYRQVTAGEVPPQNPPGR